MRESSWTPTVDPPSRPVPTEHEQLVEYLESDQLVEERARPLGPAHLSRRAALGLLALRVFAFVMAAMVIYTFVAQL